jgi:hypothetical protein
MENLYILQVSSIVWLEKKLLLKHPLDDVTTQGRYLCRSYLH